MDTIENTTAQGHNVANSGHVLEHLIMEVESSQHAGSKRKKNRIPEMSHVKNLEKGLKSCMDLLLYLSE